MSYKCFGNTEILKKRCPVSITFGNFDGFHIGHQYLINYLNKQFPNPIVVVTFDPHPAHFFNSTQNTKLITSLQDKVDLLLKAGVDVVYVKKFSQEFSEKSADEFCDDWLYRNFDIHNAVLGYDFSYGKNRSGDFSHFLKKAHQFGWHAEQLGSIKTNDNEVVSSTKIRTLITKGSCQDLRELLGRNFFLSGKVVHGDARGRKIGFPTANLEHDPLRATPKYGVYSCIIEIEKYPNKKFKGVMNCGVRPSIDSGLKVQIEAHIFNFNEDIYGQKVKFHLVSFLRCEAKFENLESLKAQIALDVQGALHDLQSGFDTE